jgi:protein SCO1/2
MVILSWTSGCSLQPHDWHGTTYQPPIPAPEIEVPGSDFTLSKSHGKITLLYFGYTFCPDVCPATVAIMSQVFERMNASSETMQFVMISVDPERETPEAVDAYMRRFHPDFIGLWTERTQLDTIMEAYGVITVREPSENPESYLITHTARVFLIDQDGNLRAHYPFGTSPEDFIADLRFLNEAR